MKINKIYISAFGGLKDFTLELNDKMNVIFGENENGKTTIMNFILAMFYGTGNKTKNLETSIRAKYTPFDGSSMGGRIFFSKDGKDFCLERQFLKSDSTDKLTLTDLATGESVSVPGNIGVKLFSMGAEAFKNSMFIGAEKAVLKNDEAVGELNARLSSVALTGNADNSFEKITGRIEKAKEKVLSKTEKAGLLFKAKTELSGLLNRLENAKADAKRKAEIVYKKEELIKKGQELLGEYSKYKKITDSKEDIKNAERLKEYLSLKSELDELNKKLTMPNGVVIDSGLISKVKFCLSKLEIGEEKCENLKNDIDEILKAIELGDKMSVEETEQKIEETKKSLNESQLKKDELNKKIEDLEKELKTAENNARLFENSKKKVNIPLLVFGIVFSVVGTVAGLIVNPMLLISAVCGIILILLGFIIKPNNERQKTELKEKVVEIKDKIAETKSETATLGEKITIETGKINMWTSVMNADQTVKENRERELNSKRERLAEETEKLNDLKREYQKVLNGTEIDKNLLGELEKSADEQKNLKLNLSYISKDLGNISYEEAREKLEKTCDNSEYSGADFELAEKKREELGNEMAEIKQEITALETELKTSFRNSEQPEILQREISDLEEKIKGYKDFVLYANIANKVLAESFANVRQGYGSALEEKTLENFARLTNGKYKNINVSKSFDVSVEDKNIFGMKEIGYLSTGTIDQAFLSLRLAICELIGETESAPIMLDDALSNYDDKRTAEALKFLNEKSDGNQIMLFTCHNSVVDLANESGITAIKLK